MLMQGQQQASGRDAAGQGNGGDAGRGGDTVTITRKEYELLLLRDRAISVLAEGMTIADCSKPDMPLM